MPWSVSLSIIYLLLILIYILHIHVYLSTFSPGRLPSRAWATWRPCCRPPPGSGRCGAICWPRSSPCTGGWGWRRCPYSLQNLSVVRRWLLRLATVQVAGESYLDQRLRVVVAELVCRLGDQECAQHSRGLLADWQTQQVYLSIYLSTKIITSILLSTLSIYLSIYLSMTPES